LDLLLAPSQKALVNQVPSPLPVALLDCSPVDRPFLCHACLLDVSLFPGGYRFAGATDGANTLTLVFQTD